MTDVAARVSGRMARGSGLNLVGAVCKQSALFFIMFALALKLGADDVGRYAQCYALLSLLGLLALAGLRSGLTRFVAIHLADDDPARLRGTVWLGLGLTLVSSILMAVALVLGSSLLAGVFFDDPSGASDADRLRWYIVLVALTLPASAVQDAALAATQGWRSQKEFALIGLIFDPVSRLLLTVGAIYLGAGLKGALWALVAASWLGAVLACLSLHRRMRTVPRAPAVFELRSIFSFSMVSWFSALAGTGLIWAGTLLLGALSSDQNVGIFTVATRLVMLAVFVMAPINAAFTPHIAHLSHVGDTAGMSRAYGNANRWIVRLSLPAFIVLLIFPRDLLTFFDKPDAAFSYATGASVTVILAIGQMVSAAAGPCGSVLNMSGRVVLNMVDNVGALLANIALNLWLIDGLDMGMEGAAIAWSLSLSLANVAKVLQVRGILGVRSADTGWWKTFLAAVPAVAVGLLVDWLTNGWVSAVVLGFGAVTVTFVAVLALVGIGDEDAAIVRSVLQRVGLRARPSS